MTEIRIAKRDGGSFDVHYGDRYAEELTFDEMLGMVATLTMPEKPRQREWLKTAEEWQKLQEWREQRRTEATT